MIFNKRGSTLLSESMPEIILAAASVFILIILLVNLIGSYNKNDEIAKGLFDYLEKSISFAEKSGEDNYLIYREYSPTRYFLVYFGNENYADSESFDLYNFFLSEKAKNTLCVCPVYEDMLNPVTCNLKYCKNLKYPITGFNSAPLDFGSSFNITFKTNNFQINEIKSKILIDASIYKDTKIRQNACSFEEIEKYKEDKTLLEKILITFIGSEYSGSSSENLQKICLTYGSIRDFKY